MSGTAKQGQSRGELETARALNTVATIGAGHALWTSLPESTRKKTVGRLVPKAVAAQAAKVKGKVAVPKGAGRKAVLATTGAWLGFHGAELAGDVMARRSINQQLNAKKVEKMDQPLIEQSFVSKAETAPVTGHGTNIEKGLTPRKAVAGAAVGLGAGAVLAAHARKKPDSWLGRREQKSLNSRITKRYYDAEADRQRRIGAAAGILGGTSIVTGAAAARGVKVNAGYAPKADRMGMELGWKVAGKKRPVRGKAGLAAASVLTGLGSLAAYKRGISRRNETWQ